MGVGLFEVVVRSVAMGRHTKLEGEHAGTIVSSSVLKVKGIICRGVVQS